MIVSTPPAMVSQTMFLGDIATTDLCGWLWAMAISCRVASQGTSAADSSSCVQRASLLLSACTYEALAQGPVWAHRWALTHPVPEAAQLYSGLLGGGRPCGTWAFFFVSCCARSSQLVRVPLVLGTGLDRVSQHHCVSPGEGGCHCSCHQGCHSSPVLGDGSLTPVTGADLMRYRGDSCGLRALAEWCSHCGPWADCPRAPPFSVSPSVKRGW